MVAGAAVSALVAGDVQVAFTSYTAIAAFAKSGKVRMLANADRYLGWLQAYSPLLGAVGGVLICDYFLLRRTRLDLIKLYGSMELAPLTGLADAIVDLVSSGNTLRANQLVEVEQIMPSSARRIVNPAALKLERAPMRALIEALAAAVARRSTS